MNDGKTLWIGGEWHSASSQASFRGRNPSTGQELGEIADASPADARRAVDAAARAFPAWRGLGPFARGEFLLRAAAILESRAPEYARILIEETGSIFGKAMFEIGFAAAILRTAAAQCLQPTGEGLPSALPGRSNLVERVPAGVVP